MSDDFFYRVLQNELLLKNIFSFLDIRSLYRVQSVTKQWRDVSKQVIKRRENFVQIFKTCIKAGNGKSNLRLVRECGSWDLVSEQLENETKNGLWYPLKFGLLFHGPCTARNSKVFKLSNSFRKCLAPDSQFIHVISRSGIIGWNSSDSRSACEVQATVANSAGISYLLWSDLGVDAQIFKEGDSIEHLLPSGGKRDMKGLIVFTSSLYDENDHIMPFPAVEKIHEAYDGKLAVGGLVVQYLNNVTGHEEANQSGLNWVGVALSGNNLSMASCVFLSENSSDLREEMFLFRQSLHFNTDGTNPDQKTVGVLLACNGRGGHMFGEANTEVDVFSSVFPGVRITGLYGDGEFGLDYWPRGGNPVREPEDDVDGSQWWHFYSSVLILINVQVGQ